MGDPRQEGSPLTDLSPLLGVAEAVAPEGTQFIASDLSTEVAETILNLELPQ